MKIDAIPDVESHPTLVVAGARVVTLAGADEAKGGVKNADLGVLEDGDVVVDRRSGKIVSVKASSRGKKREWAGSVVIEARGRALTPGFVDCHTHACFSGSRIDEWEMKLGGKSYQEIAAQGGGIMSSVRAVRGAQEEELERLLRDRLRRMLMLGTTSVEVKSGYGLTLEHERKMLRVIQRAMQPMNRQAAVEGGAQGMESEAHPSVSMTALLGHALDPDDSASEFVRRTIEETLPKIVRDFGRITLDAYCEKGAWSVTDCERLFSAGKRLGCGFRVHTDQFTSVGMVQKAIEMGARSVDHLESAGEAEMEAIGRSGTAAVVLPCCGFHLDGRYADGRRLWDAGARVCIATNFNPGSSPCLSMGMAMGIAVRSCGLTASEAIVASTRNPARLLGLSDRGTIEAGKRADLVLLEHEDERGLAYEFGSDAVRIVIAGGEVVRWVD